MTLSMSAPAPLIKRVAPSHRLQKPSFALLHIGGWLFYVLAFTLDNMFFYSQVVEYSYNYIALSISGAIAALLTWPMRYVYRQFWRMPPELMVVSVVGCCLLLAAIWTPLKNAVVWSYYGDDVIALVTKPDATLSMFFMSISYSFFMLLAWSSLYFGINYHFRLMEEKAEHLRAARLSHTAQIKMLRYQINPHFLFNTLNAISTLVLKGYKDRANGMLSRLSTFLRFSLDNDPEKKIRLYDELKALMLYLEIEKTRFGERLSIEFRVDKAAEVALVPSLILQPLVENSIKYAIARMPKGGHIRINAKVKNKLLHLEVADNGPGAEIGIEQAANGVGLRNIRERLEVLYPRKSGFEIRNLDPQGFSVQIWIPIEEHEWRELPPS